MRAPREDDIAQLVALADNRHVAQMLARMPHPYGEAEARDLHRHVARSGKRRRHLCADARRRRTRRPAAFVGCAGLNVRDRGLELGYWIGEPHWRRGLCDRGGARAGRPRLPRDRHIGAARLRRVINPASRRVIQKCGFQYAGQGMMHSLVAGQVPVERYRLDRKTWESLRTWSLIERPASRARCVQRGHSRRPVVCDRAGRETPNKQFAR